MVGVSWFIETTCPTSKSPKTVKSPDVIFPSTKRLFRVPTEVRLLFTTPPPRVVALRTLEPDAEKYSGDLIPREVTLTSLPTPKKYSKDEKVIEDSPTILKSPSAVLKKPLSLAAPISKESKEEFTGILIFPGVDRLLALIAPNPAAILPESSAPTLVMLVFFIPLPSVVLVKTLTESMEYTVVFTPEEEILALTTFPDKKSNFEDEYLSELPEENITSGVVLAKTKFPPSVVDLSTESTIKASVPTVKPPTTSADPKSIVSPETVRSISVPTEVKLLFTTPLPSVVLVKTLVELMEYPERIFKTPLELVD